MEIRVLGEEDAAAYWSLRLEGLRLEPLAFGVTPEEHEAVSVEETAERLKGGTEENFFLGGFEEGSLVAVARFGREPTLKERHRGHIYGVYVTPAFRGRGVIGALLGTLLDRVRRDPSLEQIHLGVGTHNEPALRAYRKLGFEVYGIEPRALKVGSKYVDEHQMMLSLR